MLGDEVEAETMRARREGEALAVGGLRRSFDVDAPKVHCLLLEDAFVRSRWKR